MADEITNTTSDPGMSNDPGMLQSLLEMLGGIFSPSSAEAAGPTFEQRQQLEQQKLIQQLQILQEKARIANAQRQTDPLRQAQVTKTQAQAQKTQADITPQRSLESILGGDQPQKGSSMFLYGGGVQPTMESSNDRIRMILEALMQGEAPPGQDPNIGMQAQQDFTPINPQPGQTFGLKGYQDEGFGFNPQTGAFTNIGVPGGPSPTTAPSKAASALKRAQQAAEIKKAYPGLPEKELERLLDAQEPSPTAGLTGKAVLEGLDPGLAAMVKQVAEYKLPIAGFGGMDAKTRAKVLPLVAQYDPTFDATKYAARVQLQKDFATGKMAQNKVALNTAIQHMASFKQAADDLQNATGFPGATLWNYAANKGLESVGDPRVKKLTMAADALAGELSKVFKGTAGTDQEIKAWREELSTSASPEQFEATVAKGIELLGGRFEAIRDIWTKTMEKPLEESLLSPGARGIIKKLGFDPDVIEHRSVGDTTQMEAPITKPSAQIPPVPASASLQPGRVPMIDPQGNPVQVKAEQVQQAIIKGYQPWQPTQ